MEAIIYNTKGKEEGKLTLPSFFATPWKSDVVHQVVISEQNNARKGLAHTKGRGDVRGGGKKPWQQKGTGRARHGSIRSPIWRGGGITHGPLAAKNYQNKINKKVRRKALAMALSKKFTEGQILFIDKLPMTAPKAKDARTLLTTLSSIKTFQDLGTRRNNAALLAIPAKNDAVRKSFRNFGNVKVEEARNLSVTEVLGSKYLLIAEPLTTIEMWEKKLSN